MGFSIDDLTEAKRQIDSMLHKLREVVRTLASKRDVKRYRPQIMLAERRIKAFEIAGCLIEKELQKTDRQSSDL